MPQFAPSETKTARAPITIKPAGLNCVAELYLGAKVATSGLKPFASTGAEQSITFPITMPSAQGTYPVYLDVLVAGQLVGAYQALEDVVIVISEVWFSPTWHVDPGGQWAAHIVGGVAYDAPEWAYDGSLGTFARAYILRGQYCSFLELWHAPRACTKIRVSCSCNNYSTVDIDIYYNGAWHGLYDGYTSALTTGEWLELAFSECQLEAVRIRSYNGFQGIAQSGFVLFEAQFWGKL